MDENIAKALSFPFYRINIGIRSKMLSNELYCMKIYNYAVFAN